MKASMILAACALAASLTTTADAREGRTKYRKAPTDGSSRSYYRRSSTVDHRGLCQRDNGRPLESLNLNHKCDREEYWERIRERGGNGRH
ncbi:MAG: hypothetical protein SFW09_22165 [Hyphomicrobiaceae bacterium]|nr:hypothetical protein [Hyphomicrobiaceae bacterium]